MSRHLRFVPEGGALVEVTCRTIQGRLLLCPSPQLNDSILGVLGRAQRDDPVEIAGYVFASNHLPGLRGKELDKGEPASTETVRLSPLPSVGSDWRRRPIKP